MKYRIHLQMFSFLNSFAAFTKIHYFFKKVDHVSNLFEILCIYVDIKPDYGTRVTIRMSTERPQCAAESLRNDGGKTVHRLQTVSEKR
jgi:hypothetical protein